MAIPITRFVTPGFSHLKNRIEALCLDTVFFVKHTMYFRFDLDTDESAWYNYNIVILYQPSMEGS